MKRIICAVLAVVMIVSLAGCGGEKPEEVVERVTQAIKEGKMESVKENIDLNALESLLPDSGSESTKAATSEESLISGGKASYFPIDDTLGKITVKILSSEKDGDHATVKAECTAVDLTEFLKGYMQKSMENALDFTKDDAGCQILGRQLRWIKRFKIGPEMPCKEFEPKSKKRFLKNF